MALTLNESQISQLRVVANFGVVPDSGAEEAEDSLIYCLGQSTTLRGLYIQKTDGDYERVLAESDNSIAAVLTNKDLSSSTNTLPDLYPINTIWHSAASANPSTYLFGQSASTWVAHAAGRTIVGKAATGTFATAGATGGSETHTNPLSSAGGVPFGLDGSTSRVIRNGPTASVASGNNESTSWGGGSSTITTSLGLIGATDAGSSLQPYIVEYIWLRTA
jgi:hypothetical protein